MEPVLIVGGGIAGVAAARELTAAGVDVRVRDRGRRLGGRMASRTTKGRPVDTGASYFTAAEPDFVAVVDDWERRGLARPWTDTLAVYGNPEKSETSGPTRWAAPRGLRSLVEDLARDLEISSDDPVERLEPGLVVDGRSYAAVVLAMPDPQARRLLDPAYADAVAALTDPYEPVLALTAIWPKRTWPDLDGAFNQRRRHHRLGRRRRPTPRRRSARAGRPLDRRFRRPTPGGPGCRRSPDGHRPAAAAGHPGGPGVRLGAPLVLRPAHRGTRRALLPERVAAARGVWRRLARQAPGRGRVPLRPRPRPRAAPTWPGRSSSWASAGTA